MTHEMGKQQKMKTPKQGKTTKHRYTATKKNKKKHEKRPNTKRKNRCCEQAKAGEAVVAQGKVEHVTNTQTKREHYRMILGNTPSDFMALSRF